MKSTEEIGLKIFAAQRAHYRYSGVSAEMEKRGVGASRFELSWVQRHKQEEKRNLPDAENGSPDQVPIP
jgi:predicted alpha/beta-hydrolase family hydrolase